MELPLIGDVGLLNAGIIGATLLIALLLHLSMNSGTPAGTKLDDKAFESLVNGDGDGDDDGGGWDDDGEVEIQKKTMADAKADSAKLEAAQKMSPYKIGDRVVLQGLKSAAVLNGRHGTIADTWESAETQRYPVDLDLYDPRKGGAVAVKVANLKKEPPIPAELEEKRAPVAKGVLSEEHGRAVSFICSTMRQSVVQSVLAKMPAGTNDMPDPKQVAQLKTPNNKGVYPSLVQYLTREILVENKLEDLEKQLNPTEPRGAYRLIKDSMTDPLAVASWNLRISGEFWILGGNAHGTIVVPACNSRAVYCVAGLKLPLAVQIMQQTKVPRPPKFNLTLLPWYGRLVHDPFLSTTTNGERIEVASPQKTQELMRAVQIATAEKRIIYRLRQAEVEGGSTEGIPFVPFQELNKPAEEPPKPKPQEPATEAERALIDNVADFEPHRLQPPGPNGNPPPLAAWNFIRKGETKEDNPDHDMMVVAANGQQIGDFQSKDVDPTAAEILKKMLGIAAKGVGGQAETVGKRPSIVGVDCRKTVERLQFLLKDSKDIRVVGIQVTRRPRGADGQPVEPKRNDVAVE
eukprot:CAMPEP_0181060728 /NCGR_PEP_ID=MMETSP1070-20121207/22131_1 /TAXON_ID=265543 /ORGANISM="Minutocellus polymorphus, Strain NH13" /LENGTH=574 /DNA_ID=CAMNT_0023140613 /DNA_START=255 /DNA_END=1980 /DNA_ORIENTATION=+